MLLCVTNLWFGAAVIRDHMGKLAGACVHKFQVDDPLEGEVCAAWLGIKEAMRRGIHSLLLRL